MVKKYHLSHGTIKHTLIEYADYTRKWAELGSKLSKMLFLELSSLEEDMIEQVREQLRKLLNQYRLDCLEGSGKSGDKAPSTVVSL